MGWHCDEYFYLATVRAASLLLLLLQPLIR